MIEVWAPVVGYEGAYEVSDLGRVRSLPGGQRHGKILKLTPAGRGYLSLALCLAGQVRRHYVHHLVATAFIGPRPAGLDVCHRNGDMLDNRPANLRYDTVGGNMRDAIAHGTHRGAAQTHCKHGHPLSGENVYLQRRPSVDGPVRVHRVCKKCARHQQGEYRSRKLART